MKKLISLILIISVIIGLSSVSIIPVSADNSVEIITPDLNVREEDKELIGQALFENSENDTLIYSTSYISSGAEVGRNGNVIKYATTGEETSNPNNTLRFSGLNDSKGYIYDINFDVYISGGKSVISIGSKATSSTWNGGFQEIIYNSALKTTPSAALPQNQWVKMRYTLDTNQAKIFVYMGDNLDYVGEWNYSSTIPSIYQIELCYRIFAGYATTIYLDNVSFYKYKGAEPVVKGGLAFNADCSYQTEEPLAAMPKTFEATVYFPENMSGRGGAAIGNFQASGVACTSLELYTDGQVRMYYINDEGTVIDHKFDLVNAYTGKWVHIAVTADAENNELKCYIDGVLAQTISATNIPSSLTYTTPLCIGGDLRSGNSQYFKGSIKNAAIYSDVRTAEEIAADYADTTIDTDGLVGYYDFSSYDSTSSPLALTPSNNGGIIFYSNAKWIETKEPITDYAYAFAAVGDIQTINYNDPANLTKIYDWIAKVADEKKIEYVFTLGDITDANLSSEWALAKAVMNKMNGVVPYSFIRGNHDTMAMHREYFTVDEYDELIDGNYGNDALNTYKKIHIGNMKYLMLNLDFGPHDDVLAWANQVVTAHPDYNVIVTTHAYIIANGDLLTEDNNTAAPTNRYAYNNGDDIWEKLIRHHKNISMVICGHVSTNNIVVSTLTGDNGNKVTQILVDPQSMDKATNYGSTGMVALFYFSEDGKHIETEYYSTVKDAFYLAKNQFEFDVDTIDSSTSVPDTVEEAINITDISFNVNLSQNTLGGNLLAALYDRNGYLLEAKSYKADEDITVTFTSVPDESYVKLAWWDGESIKPLP